MLTFEHLRCTINMTCDLTAYARCIKLNDWWQMEAAKIIISQRVEDDKEPLSEFVPKSPLSCYGAWKNRMAFLYWAQARCQIGWRKEGNLCIVLPCWQNRKQSGSATPSKLPGFVKRRGCFRRSCNMTIRNVFFETSQKDAPTNAVIALSGVAGLNAAEHLRSLYPKCGIIWCSDLDFSLHVFRLRIDYFLWNLWKSRK